MCFSHTEFGTVREDVIRLQISYNRLHSLIFAEKRAYFSRHNYQDFMQGVDMDELCYSKR